MEELEAHVAARRPAGSLARLVQYRVLVADDRAIELIDVDVVDQIDGSSRVLSPELAQRQHDSAVATGRARVS
jgi:hypothetical protein